MHLLSNIWSDVSLMETDSGTERDGERMEERENELSGQQCTQHTSVWC